MRKFSKHYLDEVNSTVTNNIKEIKCVTKLNEQELKELINCVVSTVSQLADASYSEVEHSCSREDIECFLPLTGMTATSEQIEQIIELYESDFFDSDVIGAERYAIGTACIYEILRNNK